MQETTVSIRVTLDDEADASYIDLAGKLPSDRRFGKTVAVPTDEISGMVNIDVDTDGRIIGVEVLNARSLLPDSIMQALAAT